MSMFHCLVLASIRQSTVASSKDWIVGEAIFDWVLKEEPKVFPYLDITITHMEAGTSMDEYSTFE